MSDGEEDGANFAGDYDDYIEGDEAAEALGTSEIPKDGDEGSDYDGEEEEGEFAAEEELAAEEEEAGVLMHADDGIRPEGQFSQQIEVLHPRDHVTGDMLTPIEAARVLSVRAEQIARTNDAFLPEDAPIEARANPVSAAKLELVSGNCPLKIRRHRIPVGAKGKAVVEEIPVRDLIVPPEIIASAGLS